MRLRNVVKQFTTLITTAIVVAETISATFVRSVAKRLVRNAVFGNLRAGNDLVAIGILRTLVDIDAHVRRAFLIGITLNVVGALFACVIHAPIAHGTQSVTI